MLPPVPLPCPRLMTASTHHILLFSVFPACRMAAFLSPSPSSGLVHPPQNACNISSLRHCLRIILSRAFRQ